MPLHKKHFRKKSLYGTMEHGGVTKNQVIYRSHITFEYVNDMCFNAITPLVCGFF